MTQHATNSIASSADAARAVSCFDAKTVLVPGAPWPKISDKNDKPAAVKNLLNDVVLGEKSNKVLLYMQQQTEELPLLVISSDLGMTYELAKSRIKYLWQRGLLTCTKGSGVTSTGRRGMVGYYKATKRTAA